MSTTIETLLDELQTYRAALEEPLEGSTDYERVNLQPDGHTLAIQGRDAFIDERALVLAAIAALEALLNAIGDNPRLRELASAALEALQALASESRDDPRLSNLVLAVVEVRLALAGSSFPELPSFEADDAVMKDLDAQLATMMAFRARVRKKAPPAIAAAVTFTISDQT